ncbi:MAG: hypothetical protein KUG71_02090 [Porticoccaceae bacterium]|nr:hypothetical protein [Porticoccaceae bacterium]
MSEQVPTKQQPLPTVSIDGVYNGAVKAVNGGYICGVLAGFVGGDAEVRINAAFPVETPLQPIATDDGGVEMYLSEKLLGSARPTTLELDIPTPPDFATARRASENFLFLHSIDVKGCYVCSPLRTPDKGLRVFIGALDNIAERSPGENLVAALWRPTTNLDDGEGNIDNAYIWSVLDCPGVYGLKLRYPESGILVLGSCAGSIKRPLPVDDTYIVSGWQITPAGGRKLHMGIAIHSRKGELMACAKQVCFDVGDTLPGASK